MSLKTEIHACEAFPFESALKPTTVVSTASVRHPFRQLTWHDIPEEIRQRIFTYYFATLSFTIHNLKDLVRKTDTNDDSITPAHPKCPTHPKSTSKDIFWKCPSTLSTTVHSAHVNLFLIHPSTIHSAHPIWLKESTFRFAECVQPKPNPRPQPHSMEFLALLDPRLHPEPQSIEEIAAASARANLSNLTVPRRWLAAVRNIEATSATVHDTIELLAVLIDWSGIKLKDSENRNATPKGTPKRNRTTYIDLTNDDSNVIDLTNDDEDEKNEQELKSVQKPFTLLFDGSKQTFNGLYAYQALYRKRIEGVVKLEFVGRDVQVAGSRNGMGMGSIVSRMFGQSED